jgi:hypothetical protein
MRDTGKPGASLLRDGEVGVGFAVLPLDCPADGGAGRR